MSGTEGNNRERRSFKRFESDLQASLFYGNMVYSGVVTNISRSGMFIRTKRQFPVDMMLMTTVHAGEEEVQVPVRIKRSVNSVHSADNHESGVGVQLTQSTKEYLDFMEDYASRRLKSAI